MRECIGKLLKRDIRLLYVLLVFFQRLFKRKKCFYDKLNNIFLKGKEEEDLNFEGKEHKGKGQKG